MDKDRVNPNKVTDSFRASATGKADAKVNTNPASKAASTLASAEQDTIMATQIPGSKESAEKAESTFDSSGVGTRSKVQDAIKAGASGSPTKVIGTFMKGKGPIMFIIGALLLINVFLFAAPASLPFATMERFSELYNNLKYSNQARSSTFANKFLGKYNSKKVNQAGYFGDSGNSVSTRRLGITRNRKFSTEDSFETNARKGSKKASSSAEAPDGNDLDADGNPKAKDYDLDVSGDAATASATLRAAAVAQAAAFGANLICGGFAAAGAIQVAAGAIQLMEVRDLFSQYAQSADQIKAGVGDDATSAQLHGNQEKMVTPVADGSDPDNPDKTSVAVASGSAQKVYNNQPANTNDPAVQSFGIESAMQGPIGEAFSAVNNFSNAADMFKTCATVKAAAGGIGLVVSFIPGANVAKSAAKLVINSAIQFTAQAAISSFLALIIPKIGSWLVRDLIGDMGGGAMMSGLDYAANNSFGTYAQNYGNQPGSEQMVAQFQVEQARIIAEEAEYDRQTKSPFDLTTTHTFLGSLVYGNLSTFANIASPLSFLSSFFKGAGTALGKLSPTINAASGLNVYFTKGNCPSLEAIGVIGDEYCQPVMVTDMSLNNTDPDAIVDNLLAIGAIEPTEQLLNTPSYQLATSSGQTPTATFASLTSGDYAIGESYKEYVGFCALRDAPYGFIDSGAQQKFNIVNTGDNSVDNVLSAGVNAIPVIDDISNIVDGLNEAGHAELVTGEHCVASESNPKWTQEYKYIQRNMLDLNLAQNTGVIDEDSNPVAQFMEEYYEQNPIDESYEGQIARLSGLDKNTVIYTLALIDELYFLSGYNPTYAGPTTNDREDPPTKVRPTQQPTAYSLQSAVQVAYEAVPTFRSRSYAV